MGLPVLGGLTLPAPVLSEPNDRERVEQAYKVRTPGGRMRKQILSYFYIYRLAFKFVPIATYTSLEALIVAADAANTGLTFVYDKWPSSSGGILVQVVLHDATKVLPDDLGLNSYHFSLTLEEMEGR